MTKEVEFSDEKAASIAGEAISSIRMIIASGAEARVTKRYAGWLEESRRRGRRQDLVQGIMYGPVFFSIYGMFALSFYLGFKLYLSGQGNVDDVSTILIVVFSTMMVAFSVAQTAPPIM